MVDKVTAANKRIAAQSAKQVIKPPPVISTTGFEIPSARKGKSLYDTLNAFKFKTGMDASEYIMGKGLPPIGKTGGEQSLELINKIVDPKDKYIKIPAELRDLEKQRYGGDNKKFKLNKMNLSKNLFSIQKEADNLFGTETTKQKIKFIEKAANKMGIVLKDVAKMGFRNLMPALGPVGVVLSIGMSKEANAGEDEFFEQREADKIKQRLMKENNITEEQMNQIANQPMDLLAPRKNMGGMMNMDEMIRPLGYEVGGIVPKPKPRIVPKEKPIDFDALMAEFDKPENKAGPGAPTGIEKIIADQFTIDPRFTMKQKIKKMLGIGGDQGSSLMDDVEDLKTLLMKSEILDNKIGKVAPMSVFMELDNMSPKELMDAYIEYGGSKFR